MRASPRLRLFVKALPVGVAAWLSALFTSGNAAAQGNYQSAPFGGRSAIMGGTGVVLGSDGAAPFLNPATLTRVEDKKVAFSSRFLGYFQRSFDDFQSPGEVDPGRVGELQLQTESHSERYLATLPDAGCIFIDWVSRSENGKVRLFRGPAGRVKAGSGKLGACLAKTEEGKFDLTSLNFAVDTTSGRVNQTQTLERDWSSWSGGPALAYTITDDLSLGLAVYIVRSLYVSTAQVATVVGGAGEVQPSSVLYQAALEASSWDTLAHVGLTYRLTDSLTAGLSLRTPSVSFHNTARASYGETQGDVNGAKTTYWAGQGNFKVASPARLAVGIGAEWDRLRLEINGFLHIGLDELARADMVRESIRLEPGIDVERKLDRLVLVEEAAPVANIGIGSELFLTRDLSLLGGFLTDFSALSKLSEKEPYGTRIFHDRTNAVHGGFGFASYTDYGDLVLGLRGSYSWGQTAAVNTFVSPARLEPIDFRGFSAVLVVAGRVSAGTMKEAARDVGDAVKGEAAQPDGKLKDPMSEPKKKDE